MAIDVRPNVKIDAQAAIERLRKISDVAEKTFVSVLNDAAFDLRKTWGDLITSKIDKPTPFSKQAFVEKATVDNLEAVVYIPPIQSDYLSLLVEGGKRTPGGYATFSDEILAPVGQKLNKYGNFPAGGPKRYLGAVADGSLGKDYFIGTPNEFDNRVSDRRAVYKIQKDGRLKLMAVFVQMQQYKKQLPLYESAEEFSEKFFEKVSSRIDEMLR